MLGRKKITILYCLFQFASCYYYENKIWQQNEELLLLFVWCNERNKTLVKGKDVLILLKLRTLHWCQHFPSPKDAYKFG